MGENGIVFFILLKKQLHKICTFAYIGNTCTIQNCRYINTLYFTDQEYDGFFVLKIQFKKFVLLPIKEIQYWYRYHTIRYCI